MSEYLEAEGVLASKDGLVIRKARELVQYLESGVNHYAHLVEVRTSASEEWEVLVLDVDVSTSQISKNDVAPSERISIRISATDTDWPDVSALRKDFPWVPHLYPGGEGSRNLCLYEQSYDELKLRWTAPGFIERIREWLSQTASGELHQGDQPLEQVFRASPIPLILPTDFVSQALGKTTVQFEVHVATDANDNMTALVIRKNQTASGRTPHIATVVIAKPFVHGIIQSTPNTLADLQKLLLVGDVDLVEHLRTVLKGWRTDSTLLRSHLILIAIFPKQRTAGATAEVLDVWAFLFMPLTVREVGIHIGLWEDLNGVLADLIQPPEARTEEIKVQILNTAEQLDRRSAAAFSGTTPVVDDFVAIGCGAIGSSTLNNLVRTGFGEWTLVDDDLLMPHNIARHALTSSFVGTPKVFGMAALGNDVCEERAIKETIQANFLRGGERKLQIDAACLRAKAIVDFSASVPVGRALAKETPGSARRVSVFLNPAGTDLVMLGEDQARRTPLDVLEMQYYRAIIQKDKLSEHLRNPAAKIRYARSCRDRSTVMPAEAVSFHSAVASRAIRSFLKQEHAAIKIWSSTAELAADLMTIKPCEWRTHQSAGTEVIWDVEVEERLRSLRKRRLPKETGGIILGVRDVSRNLVYVVDVTGAPSDSKEWPTAFIRGSAGLLKRVEEVKRRTSGMVEYLGEWHSHPDGCSTDPSDDDQKVFAWIAEHLARDGFHPVMLIVGKHQLNWIVGPSPNEHSSTST